MATPEGAPGLGAFVVGDLCWGRAARSDPFWPGQVVDPAAVPEAVRRAALPDTLCVMFLGPAAAKTRSRDYGWCGHANLLPFAQHLEAFEARGRQNKRSGAFKLAVREATNALRGLDIDGNPLVAEEPAAADLPVEDGAEPAQRCKSCGCALNTKKSRRHCKLCEKLYKEGQFCKVCKVVWHWGGTFEGAQCDHCSFWVHSECDPEAAALCALDTEEDVPFKCICCREEQAQAERAAERAAERERLQREREEIAQAKARLQADAEATLKRKLEGEQSGKAPKQPKSEPGDASAAASGSASDGGGSKEPKPAGEKKKWQKKKDPLAEREKAAGLQRPRNAWQLFSSQFFKSYRGRHEGPLMNFSEVYKKQGEAWRAMSAEERAPYDRMAQQELDTYTRKLREMKARGGEDAKLADELDIALAKRKASMFRPPIPKPAPKQAQPAQPPKRPSVVAVVCAGIRAEFNVKEYTVICHCAECKAKDPPKVMSPSEFERHVGKGTAKKWKASIRMVKPERMPIGRWLETSMKQLEEKPEDEAKKEKLRLGFEPLKLPFSIDRCAVCDCEVDVESDQLVTCEGCNVTVHQTCYGVTDLPDPDSGWLCRVCEETGGALSEAPYCCLCPVEGGALKPTTFRGLWCHAVCLQWIPGLVALDWDKLEPVDGIQNIQKQRWELLCTVCKQRMGAKIQCDSPGCYLAYHPLCARAAGFHMEIVDDGEDNVRLVSHCHRHARYDPAQARRFGGSLGPITQLSAEDADAAAENVREDGTVPDDATLLCGPVEELEGCARCREYEPQGHPRTEGKVGEEIKKTPLRRSIREEGDEVVGGLEDAGAGERVGEVEGSGEQRDGGEGMPTDEAREAQDDEGEVSEEPILMPVRRPLGRPSFGRRMNATPLMELGQQRQQQQERQQLGLQALSPVQERGVAGAVLAARPAAAAATDTEPVSTSPSSSSPLNDMFDVGAAASRGVGVGELEEVSPDETSGHVHVDGAENATCDTATRPTDLGQLPDVEAVVDDSVAKKPPASATLNGAAFAPGDRASPFPGTDAGQAAPAPLQPPDAEMVDLSDVQDMDVCEEAGDEAGEEVAGDGGGSDGENGVDEEGVDEEGDAEEARAKQALEAQELLIAQLPKSLKMCCDPKFTAEFIPADYAVRCSCRGCEKKSGGPRLLHPYQFEQHIGHGHDSHWKKTLRVYDEEGNTAVLGEWLEEKKLSGPLRAREGYVLKPVARKIKRKKGKPPGPRRGPSNLPPMHAVEAAGIAALHQPVERVFAKAAKDVIGRRVWVPRGGESEGSDVDEEEPAEAQGDEGTIVDCVLESGEAARHVVAFEGGSRDSVTLVLAEADVRWVDGLPAPADVRFHHPPRTLAGKETWVQCDRDGCNRWRRVPISVAEALGPEDTWSCDQNPDPRFAMCGVPQELEDEEIDRQMAQVEAHLANGGVSVAPDRVPVMCKNTPGEFFVEQLLIRCRCTPCEQAAQTSEHAAFFEPTRWEAHCGMAQAKKWKASIRLLTSTGDQVPIGRWLEARHEFRPAPRQATVHRGPAAGLVPGVTGPPPKQGKRVFLQATPYTITGRSACAPAPPPSRCFTSEEWEAEAERRVEAFMAARLASAAEAKPKEEKATTERENEAIAGLREKWDEMQRTERLRLAFGKSGIHGWGLFARGTEISEGALVIEYKGELVRGSLADRREREYEASGKDCYLLKVDAEYVIDATVSGNWARFTNHSCQPNTYSKVITLDGQSRIVFIAKRRIAPGEEITYDYRFDEEAKSVPCFCGAPGCRGFLC